MRLFICLCAVTLMCAALTACGGGGGGDEAVEPADTPPPVENAVPAEPEPEPIALPEGFPEVVPMLADADFVVTSVETMDADKRSFKVVGDSTLGVDKVLVYYEKAFAEDEWKVEGSSAWKENTQVSASKDGLFVMMEATIGGPASIVTITTAGL